MAKPLTVGVDVRDLRIAKTGTKTYLEEVCKAFKNMNDASIRFYFLDSPLPVYTGANKLLKYIEHSRYQFYKQVSLPLNAFLKRCDIVFCTDNCVPLLQLGYKTIPVFHDAFCFESPEDYGKLWLWTYLKTAIPAAKRSPYVVVPTGWSKKQIHHFTEIPNERLVVVHEGPKTLDEPKVAEHAPELLKSLGLKPGNYILHVGSMFKRKNIPALINAFGKIKSSGYPELKLVLAGPTPVNQSENDFSLIAGAIEANKLGNHVIFTGYLPNQSLSSIYKNALLYVFPSINEGFGIPVLEAFRYNLPVLVADNTCLPEVGGDAVLQFDPFDTDDISNKIKLVLDDEVLRADMIRKGQQRLKQFSWQQTAMQLVAIFRKAI